MSGGQTGADRGGLEAALGLKLEHGGWCPRGRLAEDGVIPRRYRLRETAEADYDERTRRNVLESDGTVLFTYGLPQGGSRLTADVAIAAGKPLLHIDLAATTEHSGARMLRDWLSAHRITTLNVAGSRESQAPGIREAVRRCLTRALEAEIIPAIS